MIAEAVTSIVVTYIEAEKLGFSNILYPSAYTVGQDGLAWLQAAPETNKITFLLAVRTGEVPSAYVGASYFFVRSHAERN